MAIWVKFGSVLRRIWNAIKSLCCICPKSGETEPPSCGSEPPSVSEPGVPPKPKSMFDPARLAKAVISIDLGACYTKVSYRREVPQKVNYREESQVLLLDGSPIIPSLGIRTGDSRSPWIFGMKAAKYHPGPGMNVFQNWKADFLLPDDSAKSRAAIEVAKHFLGWLRDQLESTGLDLANCRVRITVPAFNTFDKMPTQLEGLLNDVGWRNRGVELAREPHANIIGLATRGVNHVVWTDSEEPPRFNYGTMYGENTLFGQEHKRYFHGLRSKCFSGAAVDIGAFTTDIALITVNLSPTDHEFDDGVEEITQQSFRYGVTNELDRGLLTELFAIHGIDQSELSFEELEELKHEVYAGKTSVVLTRSAGQVELGQKDDQSIIHDHLTRFADGLWKHLQPILLAGLPEWVTFTGGGSQIPRLLDLLEARLKSTNIRRTTFSRASGPRLRNRGWCKWHDTGESLQRLATAVGAASVILDAPGTPSSAGRRAEPPRLPSAGQDLVPCTCLGGNKDCCWCGGSGYRRK